MSAFELVAGGADGVEDGEGAGACSICRRWGVDPAPGTKRREARSSSAPRRSRAEAGGGLGGSGRATAGRR